MVDLFGYVSRWSMALLLYSLLYVKSKQSNTYVRRMQPCRWLKEGKWTNRDYLNRF